MNGFTDSPGQTKTAEINATLLNSLMSSESSSSSSSSDSRASLQRVNLEGRNVGASMITRRNSTSLGETFEAPRVNASMIACSNSTSLGETNEAPRVNIYITNNVQGVLNSILVGSQVNMGDPGLWLTLKDPKLERGSLKRRNDLALGFCGMLLFAAVVAYLLITFI